MDITIRTFQKADFNKVIAIYEQGIHTGIATFETTLPNWQKWNKKYVLNPRLVAQHKDSVVGFAALSLASNRSVYKGVAEVSICVAENLRGQGIGKKLLQQLITESENNGFWTLQAGIFSTNKVSIHLHKSCGFRIVGTREKIGQLNNAWFDNVLLEKRSKIIGHIMKNILVLCTGNSCRSQMAHGYLNQFTEGKANIYSAGIETHGINSEAAVIMKEDGIDISNHTSNHVDEYAHVNFDFIITVCDHANENCPYIPSKNAIRLHHNFFDPSKVIGSDDEKHQAFLKARNEIKSYFENFVKEYL
ncbi:GNAT family N-acetyltransferase [Psychroserpens sp. MEBiC05023]